MAKIIKTNGTIEEVKDKKFGLKYLQSVVGGFVEFVRLDGGKTVMVVNEEGLIIGMPKNEKATELYHKDYATNMPIVGDVLVCDAKYID